MKPKPPVSRGRWALWYAILGVALVVFYGVGSVIWFGLRTLAWIAEFRARRRGVPTASSAEVPMREVDSPG